jgi:hypothetical protein
MIPTYLYSTTTIRQKFSGLFLQVDIQLSSIPTETGEYFLKNQIEIDGSLKKKYFSFTKTIPKWTHFLLHCGEPAISHDSHHVSLVQWTTYLLPATRDTGSNPLGGLM